MPIKFPDLDIDDLIRRYAVTSLKQLADEFGVSRGALGKRFIAAGVTLRGRSDAEALKWTGLRRNPEKMRAQIIAAHKARRGMRDTTEVQIARALTRAARLTHRGRFEDDLTACLRLLGHEVIQQMAVGPRNLDIAIPTARIAVEIVTRSRHKGGSGTMGTKRMEYLLDLGWTVVIIAADSRQDLPFQIGSIAQQVHTIVERTGRKHALAGQYGMIRRDGKPGSRPKNYLDKRPYIFGAQAS